MNKMNPVGWFDIYVNDMSRAARFYETVLNTKLVGLDDPTGETQMLSFTSDFGNYGAGGALVKTAHAKPGIGGTLIYFSVDDCAVEQARVEGAGGKVLRPKFSIGKFGFVSLCLDTEGNSFGLSSMK